MCLKAGLRICCLNKWRGEEREEFQAVLRRGFILQSTSNEAWQQTSTFEKKKKKTCLLPLLTFSYKLIKCVITLQCKSYLYSCKIYYLIIIFIILFLITSTYTSFLLGSSHITIIITFNRISFLLWIAHLVVWPPIRLLTLGKCRNYQALANYAIYKVTLSQNILWGHPIIVSIVLKQWQCDYSDKPFFTLCSISCILTCVTLDSSFRQKAQVSMN